MLAVTLGESGANLITFVVLPDSTILTAPPQVVAQGVNLITSITIENPEIGNYLVGIKIDNGVNVIGGSLIESVIASRDTTGFKTIIFNNSIVQGLPLNHTQTSASFIYNPFLH